MCRQLFQCPREIQTRYLSAINRSELQRGHRARRLKITYPLSTAVTVKQDSRISDMTPRHKLQPQVYRELQTPDLLNLTHTVQAEDDPYRCMPLVM